MSALAERGIDAYRRTEVQSRTPLELIVILYDGMLGFMGDARQAILRRDIVARREAVSRTLAIVGELQGTLDMQSGGAIAQSLDQLYAFIVDRLMDASFRQGVRPLDEAVGIVTTLREAWVGISSNPQQLQVKSE
jgi:flagellar protein FliS